MNKLCYVLLFFFIFSTHALATDFPYQGIVYKDADLWNKFESGDFDFLEEIADEYRTKKTLWAFNNRDRLLTRFLLAINLNRRQSDENKERYFETLQKWKEQYPDSPTWRRLLISYYTTAAWDSRGGASAANVANDAMMGFQEQLINGWRAVDELVKSGHSDAECFAQALLVARGLSLDQVTDPKNYGSPALANDYERIGATSIGDYLWKKGLELDPGNFHLHSKRVYNLSRRWGGQAGELEAFLKTAHDSASPEFNGTLYGMLFDYIFVSFGPSYFLLNYKDVDFDLVEKSFEILRKNDTGNKYWLNASAFYISVYRGVEHAKPLFDRIGDDPYTKGFWNSKQRYESWRDWANGKKYFEFSPLMEQGIIQNKVELLRYAVRNGADVNTVNDFGNPWLYLATSKNSMEAAEFIHENGVKIGEYPVIRKAVTDKSGRSVQFLMDKGLPPNFNPRNGMPVPHICARYGTVNNMEILLKTDDVILATIWTKYGYNLIHTAVISRNADMLNWVIKKDVDISHKNKRGETPLVFARRRLKETDYASNIAKYNSMIQILEKAGAK